MTGILSSMGPRGTALALLLLGHVLADFAFQTQGMLRNKHRVRPLLAHGAVVLGVQALALLPMLDARTLAIVAGVALLHVAIDGVKARLRDPRTTSVKLFLADQVAHVLVLLVAWRLIAPQAWMLSPVVQAVDGVPYQAWTMLSTGAVYLSALVFAGHGGGAIVRGVLPPFPEGDEPPRGGLGSLISILERVLLVTLVGLGRWAAVPLVVGAMATVRHRWIPDPDVGEHVVAGTLVSVLVAILLGVGADALA